MSFDYTHLSAISPSEPRAMTAVVKSRSNRRRVGGQYTARTSGEFHFSLLILRSSLASSPSSARRRVAAQLTFLYEHADHRRRRDPTSPQPRYLYIPNKILSTYIHVTAVGRYAIFILLLR